MPDDTPTPSVQPSEPDVWLVIEMGDLFDDRPDEIATILPTGEDAARWISDRESGYFKIRTAHFGDQLGLG